MSLSMLDVPAQTLVPTIHYYRDHPEHRAAIGQPAELDRIYTPYSDQPAL